VHRVHRRARTRFGKVRVQSPVGSHESASDANQLLAETGRFRLAQTAHHMGPPTAGGVGSALLRRAASTDMLRRQAPT